MTCVGAAKAEQPQLPMAVGLLLDYGVLSTGARCGQAWDRLEGRDEGTATSPGRAVVDPGRVKLFTQAG